MTGYEALESLTSALTFGANLIVAFVCLFAFKKLRSTAFLLLGISAGLAVFTILTESLLLQRVQNESAYAAIWTATTLLWWIDIGLYVIGVTKLATQLTKQKTGEQVGDGDAEEAV